MLRRKLRMGIMVAQVWWLRLYSDVVVFAASPQVRATVSGKKNDMVGNTVRETNLVASRREKEERGRTLTSCVTPSRK